MTKIELLKLLEDIPDDGIVVVDGHSDGTGFNDVSGVTPIKIVDGFGDWEGVYQDYDYHRHWIDKKGKIPFTAYRIH